MNPIATSHSNETNVNQDILHSSSSSLGKKVDINSRSSPRLMSRKNQNHSRAASRKRGATPTPFVEEAARHFELVFQNASAASAKHSNLQETEISYCGTWFEATSPGLLSNSYLTTTSRETRSFDSNQPFSHIVYYPTEEYPEFFGQIEDPLLAELANLWLNPYRCITIVGFSSSSPCSATIHVDLSSTCVGEKCGDAAVIVSLSGLSWHLFCLSLAENYFGSCWFLVVGYLLRTFD